MIYKKPPLCFLGNKRNQLKNIKAVLDEMSEDGVINSQTKFYDVFGGSGLIAHNIKQWYPKNEVIYNDFDDYASRLAIIETTEQIRARLAQLLPVKEKQDKLSEAQISQVKALLDEYKGQELDFIQLSTYLCFSGNYYKDRARLYANLKYNRLSYSPLNAKGYLAGVKRISLDFKKLLDDTAHEGTKRFLILDPPYFASLFSAYDMGFSMRDIFELMFRVTKPYIFFSSARSGADVFFEYLARVNDEMKDFKTLRAGLQSLSPLKRAKFNELGGNDMLFYTKGRSLFE